MSVSPLLEVITNLNHGAYQMKLSTPIIALMSATLLASSVAAQDYQTGLTNLNILDTDGDRHIEGYFWYPTDATDGFTHAHGNAVWETIQVIPSAEPVDGKKPLLVLSHGMFGNARNQAWLASALTKKGYVVAAIDHPGTSTFQRNPVHRRELWERSNDISRTITHLIGHGEHGDQIDPDRIFMAGHSLGGFTAVTLAGGRYDPDRVDADCASDPDEIVCDIFADWGVARSPADRIKMAQDWSDPRIKGFAVFDLGGTQTFSPDSLAAIDRPMFVLGAPQDIHGLDLDRESRALVAAVPSDKVQYREPPELAHFDFLGVCMPNALDILKDENPDDVFVCQEGAEERRIEHGHIANAVDAFFSAL